ALLAAVLAASPAARADDEDKAQVKALQKELAALQDAIKVMRDREREALLTAKVVQERERQRAEEADKLKRELEQLRDLVKAREPGLTRHAKELADARDQAARQAAQAQAQEERARKLEAVAREEAARARDEAEKAAARAKQAEDQARRVAADQRQAS